MPAYKDKKTGLFYVQFYYRDARGQAAQEQEGVPDRARGAPVGEELQGPQGRRHGHDLRRLLQGLRGGGEAEGPRAHLAHQGEHHLEQAPAVLRRHAHVRHKARRHSQVAELPHGVHEARRRRLQAHVTEDHLCDADELDAGLQRQLSLVMEIFNGLGEAPPSGKRAASEKIWEAKHGQDR